MRERYIATIGRRDFQASVEAGIRQAEDAFKPLPAEAQENLRNFAATGKRSARGGFFRQIGDIGCGCGCPLVESRVTDTGGHALIEGADPGVTAFYDGFDAASRQYAGDASILQVNG